MKNSIMLMKLIFDFLSKLDDEQLQSLLDKQARLKLENTSKNIAEMTEQIPEEVYTALEQKETRDEAKEYILSLNLNKNGLKQISKHYNIPTGKLTNSQLIDAIVEAVIGTKLRYDAVYNTNLHTQDISD